MNILYVWMEYRHVVEQHNTVRSKRNGMPQGECIILIEYDPGAAVVFPIYTSKITFFHQGK
jgi:hypothetical protein